MRLYQLFRQKDVKNAREQLLLFSYVLIENRNILRFVIKGTPETFYYSILDTISGQTIIGIASEDLGCYIWLDDKFSACILTFRLDDGSVYEGELLL